MREERKRRNGDIPRIYDKTSGEYLPVSAFRDRRPPGSPESNAARRAENRKRRRRRFLVIFYIFVFLAVITSAVIVSLTVLFKVDDIQITGTSQYSKKQILTASGLKKGDNLFLAKTKDAKTKLLKELPYLGEVKVKRQFPASIIVSVSQANVCGAIQIKEKYVVIAVDGKALGFSDAFPENCAKITGLEIQKAVIGESIVFKSASQQSMMKNVVDALNKNGLKDITAIDFSSTSKIRVRYQNRILIDLGLPSDLDYKVLYARKLLDADTGQIKPSERGTLNLSVAADTDMAYFDPDTGSG